ncbi:MAG: VIT family protein [Actinomycetaceae bacterium]|nr:VIT family protein [Actinomycetaceae bacterium]MDY6083139.1 VIT family protein [Actinomycetaceae bacterium]
MASKLNWLRAAVLGANDGIVSTAGLVVGVSGAAVGASALFASGIAGVIAGALSMAAGEYVSVSTQRDTERAAVERIRKLIAADPLRELNVLTRLIEEKGVQTDIATSAAQQLTNEDAVGAHARWELGIEPDSYTNPWHAAFASMLSFFIGSLIPLIAILVTPHRWAVLVTVIAVTISLAITGSSSAYLGGAPRIPATVRNVIGGLLAMGVTYWIGVFVASLR